MEIKGNVELIEACLKTTSGWKGSTIYNICNDTVNFVPHGFWDYALMFGGLFFVLAFSLLLLTFALRVISD